MNGVHLTSTVNASHDAEVGVLQIDVIAQGITRAEGGNLKRYHEIILALGSDNGSDERQKSPVLSESFDRRDASEEGGVIGGITSGNDTDTLPVGQMDEVDEHADSFLIP
jgi:hypothetical protein